MLARTADSLFWLSRYVERAEFVARILDAAYRLTALPSNYGGGVSNEWASALSSAADANTFKRHYDVVDERTVSNFLAFSPLNPSSIHSCLAVARENARSVRTALTTEMWDAINGAWLELRNYEDRELNRNDFSQFFNWVKQISLLFDGSAYRTMLRNDAYWFTRAGTAIERADNTALILDVKYKILLPNSERVGGSLDFFQWTTILREVSAFNAYHWVYRERVKPLLVADLLILNPQMPRSLANCYGMLVEHLNLIADAYGRRGESQRLASNLRAKLVNANIDRIFASGLHEFIEAFIKENSAVGTAIITQYLL